jgi:hypothetical protein
MPRPSPEDTALATNIVNNLLDSGLAFSTWRDSHPAAYDALLAYRPDMVAAAARELARRFSHRPTTPTRHPSIHEFSSRFGLIQLILGRDRALAVCRNDLDDQLHFFTCSLDTASRLRQWVNGAGLIQDMAPELSASQRELCISGLSDADWDKLGDAAEAAAEAAEGEITL